MKASAIIVAIFLGFIVAPINGIVAWGYLVGGTVQQSFASISEALNSAKLSTADTPEKVQVGLTDIVMTPYGAFGLALEITAWLQVLAAIILIIVAVSSLLPRPFGWFVIVTGVLGLSVEGVGAYLSNSFGFTNILGSVVAALSIWLAYKLGVLRHSASMMQESSDNQPQRAQ